MPTNTDDAEENDDDLVNVPAHLWHYAQDQSELAVAAEEIRRYLEELATTASIPVHTVEARAKGLASYREKSLKKDDDGDKKYSDPAKQIHDCVAARVIVFTVGARDDLANLIESRTEVRERRNPGESKYNGYDSEHLIITSIKDPGLKGRYATLTRFLDKYEGLEIQLRSVAAHAWAEYEHDIRYKSGAFKELDVEGKRQIDQWFVEAGGMRRVMDEIFNRIEALLRPKEADEVEVAAEVEMSLIEGDQDVVVDDDPRPLSEEALGELIAMRFPKEDIGERKAVQNLYRQLEELDVGTVGRLEAYLTNVEDGKVAQLMDYPAETSGVRRLDDELLAIFGERYVAAAGDDDRRQILRLRLRRVHGKFAIYSIDMGAGQSRPVTAARAVRQIVDAVASLSGPESTVIEGAVSISKNQIAKSAHPRVVMSESTPIYVATNLSRYWAESILEELVKRVPGSKLRVFRAGDLLVAAPSGEIPPFEKSVK